MNPIYQFELVRDSYNLLDPEKTWPGEIVTSTGELNANTNYKTSDFFEVEEGESYWQMDKDGNLSQMISVGFYDSHRNFLQGYSSVSAPVAVAGAKLMRVSFPASWDLWDYGIFSSQHLTFSQYVSSVAHPVYGSDLEKVFSRVQEQEFLRESLSGKLTFVSEDYDYIINSAFDKEFKLKLLISYDNGATWSPYWQGHFWKTDCTIDTDNQKIVVEPATDDEYGALLDGMDDEYDIIPLAPTIYRVKIDERPLIQVYVPGQTVIGCFLSGMYWEQDCTEESDETVLTEIGDGKLNFAYLNGLRIVEIESMGVPTIPDIFSGAIPAQDTDTQEFTNGDFKYSFRQVQNQIIWQIEQISDNTKVWSKVLQLGAQITPPLSLTLTPPTGSTATGSVDIYIHDMKVYGRLLCDVDDVSGNPTYDLPTNDIVEDNKNYGKVIGYGVQNTIVFNDVINSTPSQYGIYQPGQYYQAPYSVLGKEYFPVARNAWGKVSVWFSFADMDWLMEEDARHQIMMNNAYELGSVIKVLLAKVAPDLSFEPNTGYSDFLYGANPITGLTLQYLIAPKSNIVVSEYDQPAQKAVISLKAIFDMLRDCFRCYWFIDEGKLRIEHIYYFMNGGSYDPNDPPGVGIDLTTGYVTRNGKKWAFSTSEYSFDKEGMPARYEFGWMDEVTKPFEGYPIEIVSNFVDKGRKESINVSHFTSDVDYMMLQPEDISRDGFALLCTYFDGSNFALPYYNYSDGVNNRYLQNGLAAFCYLQQFYLYDLPAEDYTINGQAGIAVGVKKQLTQQVNFPALYDPNMQQLVKTYLGNGKIEKLSINLSSRGAKATLKYDTE